MTQKQVDFQTLIEQEEIKQEPAAECFPLQKTMDALNRDIFMDDKAIKNYYSSSTKVKARNFLTNVSYNKITAVDYRNSSFVMDCFTFLVLYLNPFYLERKFESSVEREFVNVLWAFLMPSNLYDFINENDNMTTLNKIKIKYVDVKKMMLEFLERDQTNANVLASYLEKNGILYQFLYGNLFPKCFSRIDDYGVKAKTLFNTYYQNFTLQKNVINWQNNNLTTIKEEKEQVVVVDTSPLNMTTLNDNNDDDDDKENKPPKATTTTAAAKPKTKKRKIDNAQTKAQKRELKKQKLLEQLNENTDKIKRLKQKIN